MKDPGEKTVGVILLNLGGPQHLDDVEPFLFNLFSDRKIIRLSPFPFLQRPIARMIAKKRAPKSRQSYSLIGGSSPLNRITSEQAAVLEKSLNENGSFKVGMAMRYWQPFADEVLSDFNKAGITKIIALTLYPHYSKATTGSSLDDLSAAVKRTSTMFEVIPVESWPDHPDYIKSLAGAIEAGKQKFASDNFTLVYSAHSLPVSFIKEGDPYLEHLKKTIAALEKQTGIKGRLCFQSRSGPVEWLSPSTPDMIEALVAEGVKNILMVPISFVSDHVETLYEIDIQYREFAENLGVRLERTESLNTDPVFINALKDLVLSASGSFA